MKKDFPRKKETEKLSNNDISPGKDQEIDKNNKKQIFIRDGMPGAWLSYADELKEAAEVIWENNSRSKRLWVDNKVTTDNKYIAEIKEISSISRPYILLAGFALENIIKGLMVAKDPTLINCGKLDHLLRSHKILRLIEHIKEIKLDSIELEFCEIVNDAIPYWGRYPIPLEYDRVLPETGINEELRQAFLKLFERIRFSLYKKIRNGWDSNSGPQSLIYLDQKYEKESLITLDKKYRKRIDEKMKSIKTKFKAKKTNK